VTLYLEKRELLPEGFYTLEIVEAKKVQGEYQEEPTNDLLTRVKVADGDHAGAEFSDYAKLSDKGGVKENSKALQIIEAAMDTKMEDLGRFEPEDLVGRRFMARVGTSKNGKRNIIVYDAIGPAQPPEANAKPEDPAPTAGNNDSEGNLPDLSI
jgi:hypothetical protein